MCVCVCVCLFLTCSPLPTTVIDLLSCNLGGNGRLSVTERVRKGGVLAPPTPPPPPPPCEVVGGGWFGRVIDAERAGVT